MRPRGSSASLTSHCNRAAGTIRGRPYGADMRHGTHEAIAVSLALVVARAAHVGAIEATGLAVASLYGARLPDADRLGSRIHRRSSTERRHVVVGIAGGVLRLPFVVFALLVRHRGIAHSLLAALVVSVLAGALLAPLGAVAAATIAGGVALGYASHLLTDACTPGGVRLWAPMSNRTVWLLPRRLRIPTGSLRETALMILSLAAMLALLVAH
jgi:membrane-bound metal-dependent hydrolase YbcI (DUF457 family)